MKPAETAGEPGGQQSWGDFGVGQAGGAEGFHQETQMVGLYPHAALAIRPPGFGLAWGLYLLSSQASLLRWEYFFCAFYIGV